MKKIKLSEIVKMHRKCWNELALTGSVHKNKTQAVQDYYIKYNIHNLCNDCFACHWVYTITKKSNCHCCPFKWGTADCEWHEDRALYSLWTDEGNINKRKKLASKIANLPLKKAAERLINLEKK